MAERRFCTVRFNLGKPEHQKAWSRLQNMDRTKFKSYSDILITALNSYFDNDNYEERLIGRIVAAVQDSIGNQKIVTANKPETDTGDITWDFLGDDVEIR